MRNLILALTLATSAVLGAAAQGFLELRLVAGPAYVRTKWFGPMPVKLRPQVAFWLETAEGSFVDTIYATHRSAAADWRAAAGTRRPEALPAWSHARGIRAADGLFMPDPGAPLPDAVSGATQPSSFTRNWRLPTGLPPGRYRIKAELNQSFDWNDAYPDKLPRSDPRWSEANGQPSIIWETEIAIGEGQASAALTPIGRGSIDGSEGGLRPGLEGITGAREIAASIEAVYRP